MTHDSTAARLANAPPESLIHDSSPEVLCAVAADSRLTEDLALALLSRRDLPGAALEALAKNAAVMKSRKVIVAVVAHPRTPRHVSLPIARHLYTFELMELALMPAVAADLKIAIDETILTRLESIAAGERLTLAKRGSTRLGAVLLWDQDSRIIEAALQNPRMTEAAISKALAARDAPQALVEAVCHSEKWSARREIRIALLRNQHTPLARAIVFAQALPARVVRDVLRHSRMPENVKRYLIAQVEAPGNRARRATDS